MISDVLFEAREQIAWYLTRYPETYAALLPEITTVCTAMEALQGKLDNPFFSLDCEGEGGLER